MTKETEKNYKQQPAIIRHPKYYLHRWFPEYKAEILTTAFGDLHFRCHTSAEQIV
jgi:hypothetical protein